MKCLFILSALLLLSPVFSKQVLLDEKMSIEDQKRTGVAYLTPNQRIVLEEWVNKNCNCPTKNVQEEEHKALFLSINIDNGREIQLNDNSIWEVDPRDRMISEAWLTSFPIKIVPSDDPDFPFLLVNKSTGVSVRVRKGVIPPPTPMPTPAAPGSATIPTTPMPTPPPPAGPKPAAKPKAPPPKSAPTGSVPMPPAPNPTVSPSPAVPSTQVPKPMVTPPPSYGPKAPPQVP